MANWYVDNNETIYAYESLSTASLGVSNSVYTTLGLADLTDLSGQSTWLINRIRFYVKVFSDNAGSAQQETTYGFALGGIAPVGTTGLDRVSDYQEVKGWPLKGVDHYLFTQVCAAVDDPSNASTKTMQSFSKTWTPSRRNHLALNRGQEVVWNFRHISGNPIQSVFQSVFIEARRGS